MLEVEDIIRLRSVGETFGNRRRAHREANRRIYNRDVTGQREM